MYMDEVNEDGVVDNLVANGVVVRNTREDWSAHVKRLCRIDEYGVLAKSEMPESTKDR